jgi:hypothetical protein
MLSKPLRLLISTSHLKHSTSHLKQPFVPRLRSIRAQTNNPKTNPKADPFSSKEKQYEFVVLV